MTTSPAGVAPSAPLTDWTRAQGAAITRTAVRSHHRLAELELFADGALADSIDEQPRERLQVFAPVAGNRDEAGWRRVAPGAVSGSDMLELVRRGRLWILLVQIQQSHEGFQSLQTALMDEIAEVVPDLFTRSTTSTVLISSPSTTVPYHLDGIPNLLWHIRGRKRLWLYPSDNAHFADPKVVEAIIAGQHREYIHYEPEFDGAGLPLDLEPGDVVAIPHHAPHRVENLEGLNVSLNLEISTLYTERRNSVRLANRMSAQKLHLPTRSTATTTLASRAKRIAYRTGRRLGLADEVDAAPLIVPELQLDPSAPDGTSPLP